MLNEGLIIFVLFTCEASNADSPYELFKNMLFMFGSKMKFLSTFLNDPMFWNEILLPLLIFLLTFLTHELIFFSDSEYGIFFISEIFFIRTPSFSFRFLLNTISLFGGSSCEWFSLNFAEIFLQTKEPKFGITTQLYSFNNG